MRKMASLKLVLKAWPVVFLLMVGTCLLTEAVAGWFGIDLPDQAAIDMVLKAHGWRLVYWIAAIVVVAPVLEELLFRFLAFKVPLWLLGRFARRAATIAVAVVSSALFCAAHYLDPWSAQLRFTPLDNAFAALFAFGLFQCWLYRRTNRIWAPMLSHALFNLTNLVLLFVLPADLRLP